MAAVVPDDEGGGAGATPTPKPTLQPVPNAFDEVAPIAGGAVGTAMALERAVRDVGDGGTVNAAIQTLAQQNVAVVRALADAVSDLLQLRDPVIRARVSAATRRAGGRAITQIALVDALEASNRAYMSAKDAILRHTAPAEGEDREMRRLEAGCAVRDMQAALLHAGGMEPQSAALRNAVGAARVNIADWDDSDGRTRAVGGTGTATLTPLPPAAVETAEPAPEPAATLPPARASGGEPGGRSGGGAGPARAGGGGVTGGA